MPRERWHGYIKDYDGGTLMECAINQSINYVHIHRQIEEQRRVILERIKEASNSAAVYPPLAGLGDGRIRDIFSVPGVRTWAAQMSPPILPEPAASSASRLILRAAHPRRGPSPPPCWCAAGEAGWTPPQLRSIAKFTCATRAPPPPHSLYADRRPPQSLARTDTESGRRAAPTAGLAHELHQVVSALEAKPESEAFRSPVDRAKYSKYYEDIKDPVGAGRWPLRRRGSPPLTLWPWAPLWRGRRPEPD